MCQIDAQWLSRGILLKWFIAFGLEMKAVMNQKGKVVLELCGEISFMDLAVIHVINHYLNAVNIKIQG